MLNDRQEALRRDGPHDFAGLRALFVNTSLKRDGGESHTGLLMGASVAMMERVGVHVDRLHMLDHHVPPGVHPDMTEHGWESDDWPALWDRVLAAHILVVGTPLWLGEESSVCRVLIERLYGMSGTLNERGQSVFYGRVAACVVTGNEDGVKHASMTLLYALGHLGHAIPPEADCGWIGEVGPGPSYGGGGDDGQGGRIGFGNDFTQRNLTIMTRNLMHMARLLRDGLPSHGDDRRAWAAGCRAGHENPEHRA